MKLLSVSGYTPPLHGVIFRDSRIIALNKFLICTAITALIAHGILKQGLPSLFWLAVAITAMLSKFMLSALIAAMKPTNWTICLDGRYVLIKYRSYLNHLFNDDDSAIIQLDIDEIISASKLLQTMTPKTGDPKRESLELILKPGLCEKIDVALAEERRHPGTIRGFFCHKNRHYFVSTHPGDVLRIIWVGRPDSLTATVEDILRRLRSSVILNPTRTEDNQPQNMSDELLDQHILELGESGDVIGAIKLLKTRYGFSTTEARQLVDDLIGKAARPPHPLDPLPGPRVIN